MFNDKNIIIRQKIYKYLQINKLVIIIYMFYLLYWLFSIEYRFFNEKIPTVLYGAPCGCDGKAYLVYIFGGLRMLVICFFLWCNFKDGEVVKVSVTCIHAIIQHIVQYWVNFMHRSFNKRLTCAEMTSFNLGVSILEKSVFNFFQKQIDTCSYLMDDD